MQPQHYKHNYAHSQVHHLVFKNLFTFSLSLWIDLLDTFTVFTENLDLLMIKKRRTVFTKMELLS